MSRTRVACVVTLLLLPGAALFPSVAAEPPRQDPGVESAPAQVFKLVSGVDKDDVVAELNRAAVEGYRLVTVLPRWRFLGTSGLHCLLEKSDQGGSPPFEYAVAQATFLEGFERKINALARDGFRIAPRGGHVRIVETAYLLWTGYKPFTFMIRSGAPERYEYRLVWRATGPAQWLSAMRQSCEDGFDFAALYSQPGSLIALLEREIDGEARQRSSDCGPERFVVASKLRRSALRKRLVELASAGYRLVAAAPFGWKGGAGSILLEKADGDHFYAYRFPELKGKPRPDPGEVLSAAGAEGYRVHAQALAGGLLVMEKAPGAESAMIYRQITASSTSELLRDLVIAREQGFRIVGLGRDAALLERQR